MTFEHFKWWVQTLSAPLSLIGGFFLLYWNGYISERGKNLATKKDIKKITRKIETVKSEIDVLKENQIGVQALRREAIVTYFEKLNTWKTYVYAMEFENVSYSDTKSKFDQLALEVSNAEGKLKLYMDNVSEIEVLLNEVFLGIRKIQDTYLFNLSRYSSIVDNVHLKQPILDEFTKWSEDESDIVNPKIDELTNKLRELIRTNPNPKQRPQ